MVIRCIIIITIFYLSLIYLWYIPNFKSFSDNAIEKGLKVKETMMLSEFIDVVIMSDLSLDDKLQLINFKFIEDL